MIKLSWTDIAKELTDFISEEALAPNVSDDSYYYLRGAIDFAKQLEAATMEPLQMPHP